MTDRSRETTIALLTVAWHRSQTGDIDGDFAATYNTLVQDLTQRELRLVIVGLMANVAGYMHIAHLYGQDIDDDLQRMALRSLNTE